MLWNGRGKLLCQVIGYFFPHVIKKHPHLTFLLHSSELIYSFLLFDDLPSFQPVTCHAARRFTSLCLQVQHDLTLVCLGCAKVSQILMCQYSYQGYKGSVLTFWDRAGRNYEYYSIKLWREKVYTAKILSNQCDLSATVVEHRTLVVDILGLKLSW